MIANETLAAKAAREKRLVVAIADLRAQVDLFASYAAAGHVKSMLSAGVAVQSDMERVAKVVTGTEVMT